MINLPLYIFLFVYFIALAIFAVFITIHFYHIIGSGTLTLASFLVTFFVIASTIIILYQTYLLLQGTDWQQTLTLFESAWVTDAFPDPTF